MNSKDITPVTNTYCFKVANALRQNVNLIYVQNNNYSTYIVLMMWGDYTLFQLTSSQNAKKSTGNREVGQVERRDSWRVEGCISLKVINI